MLNLNGSSGLVGFAWKVLFHCCWIFCLALKMAKPHATQSGLGCGDGDAGERRTRVACRMRGTLTYTSFLRQVGGWR